MLPLESRGLLLRFSGAAGLELAATTESFAAAAESVGLEVEPLFATRGEGLGVTDERTHRWFGAKAAGVDSDIANAWDAAHSTLEALASGRGFSAAAVPDLVEPDLLQQWPHEQLPVEGNLAAAANIDCLFEDQDSRLPSRPSEFAWHLQDAFSQLASARAKSVAANSNAVVRIAHLDTGYDPAHKTFPKKQVELNLQQNFVENDDSNNAEDPGNKGPLRAPGHGTGTLSILAGARFTISKNGYQFKDVLGGAPTAKIVPVRVGNSVVQLTTSSVAKGIAYAVELCGNAAKRIDVISMSMGGVASAAWADAVNAAYDAGIIFVAAAGNNFSSLPTRRLVYPARFGRVIAVCGVMADRQPYFGLPVGIMQGNWGPESSMRTAISAFTPNVSWARWGCTEIVRMNGQGTSSATPQVAAAAALYLQAHAIDLLDEQRYPEPWMRVEAVRTALFIAAEKPTDGRTFEKLGNGILRADAALAVAPVEPQELRKSKLDRAGFPFLNVLRGPGVQDSPVDRMLRLEATQLAQRWSPSDGPNPFDDTIADPDREQGQIAEFEIRRFLEIIADHPEASSRLKQRAKDMLSPRGGRGTAAPQLARTSLPGVDAECAPAPFTAPLPPYRTLRGYAADPSLSTKLETVAISEVAFKIPWETLEPGPVGQYLEVMDIDPASKCFYEPVKLDDPMLLAQDGLPPSEGIPQFHQQMVYAVASLTIHNFERALGRKTLWRPGPAPAGAHRKNDSHFVPRLRIYPHALREANAFYSPDKIALLFGYFKADASNFGDHMPGSQVFTCLSHDIVAHETTHALLDGMHRRFLLPSNPDVHAFHEGFADCVALFQHFTFPEILAHQIATTRGDIRSQENMLGQLAVEFGRATGQKRSLRDAVGTMDEAGNWKPKEANPKEYEYILESHARGSILVAAVFDAFLSIYQKRTADLIRLSTGGTGVLRPGAIHPDLVRRLASEAAKSAQHVLTMCIRAIDYCPPTDITFGEYLRAIITADVDLVPDDDLNYRISFIEAFRKRGIFPPGVRALSVGSLLWRGGEIGDLTPSKALIKYLRQLRRENRNSVYARSRKKIFNLQRMMRRQLHTWLQQHFKGDPEGTSDAAFLGLDPANPFEVHAARFANRNSPDGDVIPQLILGLIQETKAPVDPADSDPRAPQMVFEGGSTIITDLHDGRIRYCIRKSVSSTSRQMRQRQFAMSEFDSLRATYLGMRPLGDKVTAFGNEPFAMIHRGL